MRKGKMGVPASPSLASPSGLSIWTSANFLEAFASKVDRRGPDECWPWLASGVRGRGRISIKGRMYVAPRIAKVIADRAWPADDALACHSCDNPSCCNPAHIWWGTNSANMLDRSSKGGRIGAPRKPSTHCKSGHFKEGAVRCPVCARSRKTAWQRKARAGRSS